MPSFRTPFLMALGIVAGLAGSTTPAGAVLDVENRGPTLNARPEPAASS